MIFSPGRIFYDILIINVVTTFVYETSNRFFSLKECCITCARTWGRSDIAISNEVLRHTISLESLCVFEIAEP